jgi:hypothetical protein
MIIKTAHKPPETISVFSILTLVVFVFSIIGLFNTFESPMPAIAVGFIGVVALIFAMIKDHQRQDGVTSKYTDILNRNFCCPECKQEISEDVKHEDTDGLPLLYFCKSCDVLWHTGNHQRST